MLKAIVLFAALPLFAVDVQQNIRDGVALYDAGKYDEAIATFKAALEQDPSNADAAYELGLTYHAKGDTAACRATLAPLAEKEGPGQSSARKASGRRRCWSTFAFSPSRRTVRGRRMRQPGSSRS